MNESTEIAGYDARVVVVDEVPTTTLPTAAQAAGEQLINTLLTLIADAESKGKRVVGVRQLRRALETFRVSAL